MPTPTRTDPRAWRAGTIDRPAAWYHPLSDRCLAAIDRDRAGRRPDQPPTELTASAALRDACAAEFATVRAALETGRGFVVITTGSPPRYDARDLPAVYWL